MRTTRLLLLGTLALSSALADGASLRHQCRRACRPLVKTCAESLPLGRICFLGNRCIRLASCARQRHVVQQHCRAEGPAYCEADWGPTLNRCSAAWADDLRGEAEVTVHLTFGQVVTGDFAPECIRVSPGTRVTFTVDQGDFSMCSLVGGVVGTPDAGSPFAVPTTGGTVRSFTLPTPGTFPYYCADGVNLAGAVIVEP